ncbi:hypothetical protein BHM03_00006174 [Ensete ventricosum]|nr:hypothetical protein BHM03_00006174 [Ensete ventricosum]
MAAKRYESEGSSDWRKKRAATTLAVAACNFVAAGGVGCSKGAAAIGGRQGSGVHDYCGGGSGGIERGTATGRVHFDVGRDQGSWQRKIVASSISGSLPGCDQVAAGRDQSRWQREIAAAAMKTDGSEGSLLVAFVPQRIAAGCDQGGWQREIAASSIVQREMHAAVEGIREIG